MTCVVYRSVETTVRMGPIIHEYQERLTYVGWSYLAGFCQAVAPTNGNSPLLWISSACITIPFEGPSSLPESAWSDRFLRNYMLTSNLGMS